jgi:hypothetical protein|tara:strand:- start:209 stop:394 length:186 start_codon:yes stop_codon:yes gene_type:complete
MRGCGEGMKLLMVSSSVRESALRMRVMRLAVLSQEADPQEVEVAKTSLRLSKKRVGSLPAQ